jgi:elongation factor 1-gamma
LTFGEKAIDLHKERDAEFFKKFPMGKVPVLDGGEVNLFESNAIGYYGKDMKFARLLLYTDTDPIIQYIHASF